MHLPAFIVSVNTGMRITEQFTLTRGQVNLKRPAVRRTETKNGSARTVHLTGDSLAAIEALKRSGLKPADLVFPNVANGGHPDTRQWFQPALKKADIDGYLGHGNRHTFCSWRAMAGATIEEIQELAGHPTITLSARYAISHLAASQKPADAFRCHRAPAAF